MEGQKKLHLVVFPWLAFGHINPYLELSKRLAAKGHHISFVSTPRNLKRLPNIPQHLLPLISLCPLPFPRLDSLPPNAEATSDVPFDKIEFLNKACDGLQEPLTRFLKEVSPIDWIIYDFCYYWLPPIADTLGIRKVYFSLINGRGLSAMGPSLNMIKDGDGTWTDPEALTMPLKWIPFPNNVVYRLHEAKNTIGGTQKNASGVSGMFRAGCSINGCDVLAVRSCVELDKEYLKLLEMLHGKPVLPTGLLPVSDDTKMQGGKDDETWGVLSGWLNRQRKGSVVYVALGSELAPSQDQVDELAHGLESSGYVFLWALRKPVGSRVDLPDGFEDRTKDRGLVWKGWAPQPKILGHDSVGAFLTHCGWSSIIEGLQFGRPLIMLPFVLDQGLNARAMEEKKLGIEIPRNEEDGSFTSNSVQKTLKMVLNDETGIIMKEEAKKMSRIVSDKNVDSRYIDNLEEYLYNHRPVREP
ncbi:hypothetical protein RND81_11G236500 [Saponaria officinalis]|uniref:Glycosyltransferase n=1 Tax=Saponaria officinalis TaxID=3572 RepID=A0AAW1HRU6_SAPOF